MTLTATSHVPAVAQIRSSIVTARSIVRAISPVVAEFELTVDEWLILDSLSRQSGQTMAQLAGETMLPASSLTRIVDKLVSSAMMYRRPNPYDKRQIFVYISARGEDLIALINASLEETR